MITGLHDDEIQEAVSPEERAARFSQTPTAIWFTGSNHTETAYQLERRLFDNGHGCTVLETEATASVINVIKNAGLIGLCTDSTVDLSDIDIIFNTDNQTLDDFYALLKEQKIIY